jgi:hypothetical protein
VATPRRPDRPERQFQVEDFFDHRRPKFLLWVNTAVNLHTRMLALEPGVGALAASQRLAGEEETVRPEDTLHAAGSVQSARRSTSVACRACWRGDDRLARRQLEGLGK